MVYLKLAMSIKQIHEAYLLRSLGSMARAWQSDESLDVESMTNHLEKICELIDGNIEYKEFLVKTGIKDSVDS